MKIYPVKDTGSQLTQEVTSFGRTGATYQASFYLTSGSGSTPFAQWKLMWERWVANSLEIVKLTVDYGGGNFEYVEGLLRNLTKGVSAAGGPVRWIVTINIEPTNLSLS